MHCPRCGAPLPDGDIFCGNCGFKPEAPSPLDAPVPPEAPRAKRSLALPIVCICLTAALIASGIINVVQWMQSNDLQAAVDEKAQTIDTLHQEIDSQDATIQEQNLTIVDQEATIQDQSSKLWFYEEYVVVVPDDGSELYHTYGCDHFDDSYFWAFNLAAAEQKGYTPCPYCQ